MISNPRNANSEITGLLAKGQSKIINRNNTVTFPQVPVISESEILPDFWAQSAGEQRVRSACPDRATGYSTKHSLASSSSLPAGVQNKTNRIRTLIPEGREKVNRRISGPPVTSWERTEDLCPTISDSKRTQEKSYKRSNKSNKITHKTINTDIKGRTRHVKGYVKQYREESGSNPSTDTEADSIIESRLPEFSGVQQAARAHLDNPTHLDTASCRNTNQMIEEMCGQLALSRLPISEPEKFDGRDPLSFPVWKLSFDALVNQRAMSDTDRLNLLNQFLGGEARAAISGYMMLEPHEAYQEAYRLLLDRYGDNFKIANAFRDRLKTWSRVGGLDAMGLRKFVDFLKQCRTAKRSIPALRSLDDESENAEMLKKLPVWLSRQWLRRVSGQREATGEFPSFEVFVEFLVQEEKILNDPLARVIQKVENPKEKGRGTSFASESQSFSFASSNQNMIPNGRNFGVCTFCAERHSIEICKKFSAEPFDFRQKFVQENRLCYGCLVRGHVSRECRNRRVCQICKNYHPTSMHRGDSLPEGPLSTMSVTACASNNHLSGAPRKSSMIVPIFISHCDNPEREELVYAMLDTQSDSSFVTENTARALGLKGKEVHLSLSTMTTNDRVIKCSRFNNLEVRGYESNKRIVLPQAYSRKSIPVNRQHIPSADMTREWPYLKSLNSKLIPVLNCEVGVLIGYDCPKALTPREVISAAEDRDGPFGVRTDLGWGIVGVISGSADTNSDLVGLSHRIVANQVTGSQITLQRRAKEVVSPADCLRLLERDFSDRAAGEEGTSVEERRFLQIMEEGTVVDRSGHYSMPLPFNEHKERLFDNRALVMNRAVSLKRKLNKNNSFKAEYVKFMNGMIERGDAEEVQNPSEVMGSNVWYLPHFGVYHKMKGKLRVVFDCAARYRGVALNDTLLKGPDYLNSLTGILCRFRKHPVAFCCDAEKMFYAFHVHPEDRDCLRFLWWKEGDTSQPLSTFRMTAHLFGAVSSPACASFGLRRLASEFPDCGEDVRSFVREDFYVDDGLKSVPTEESAIDLIKRTVKVCSQRGVRLHKFSSNSKNLLSSLPESECAPESNLLSLNLDEYPTERVLGMIWNLKADSFQYRVKLDRTPDTRRGVLSVTSSIFDPLGWVAPFTIKAKMVLQELCREGLDWDDKVPSSILKPWETWYKEAELLHHINIKRWLQAGDRYKPEDLQLHHFADASERAYGACSYLRVRNSTDQVSVHLVMAKARVAPIASMTMPRLELMAAVIAARLSVILERELRYTGIRHFFWTDSQIVLGYLHNEARRFKIFVSNRVQEIHDACSPSQWRHIPGQINPADLASRGVGARCLADHDLWYHGPPFLRQKNLVFEDCRFKEVSSDDKEIRRVVCSAIKTESDIDVHNFSFFSSWKSLCRGLARAKWIAKLFKRNLSIKARLQSKMQIGVMEPLTVSDLQAAEHLVIRTVQQSYYAEELEYFKSKENISRDSALFKLDCFLDEEEILRVGGRLKFTNLYSSYKHPIVLPKDAHVSMLLVRDSHQAIHHQGRGMTINEVRSRGYWIVGLNSLVKGLIRSCVICRAQRGSTTAQKMADLPPDRAECSPPFTYCGMDFFGPFVVKEKRSEIKRYGAIFTCLTTRAVHIEMAYSLTTESFIQSLRKFISVRGPVRLLRCDNGTNFVGANKELSKAVECIREPELRAFVIKNSCDLEFRMNPPGASHMGGAWERLIGVVRSVLNVILDQHSTRLDDNSLSTFLYEVAAVINSRPLSLEHITDPNHPEPLTPNHLLTGKSKVVMPPPGEFSQNDIYGVKRWRCVQALTDHFWQRWKKEYLQYLQLRSKWQRKEREMRVGDIVLLTDVNTPRNDWRKGVVTEVMVSHDGFVRTVRLRTAQREDGVDSTLIRPVHKLVLLLPGAEKLNEAK